MKPIILNQGKEGACTVYALCGAINTTYGTNKLDPVVVWDSIKTTQAKAGSWWIQAATKYAMKQGRIKQVISVLNTPEAIECNLNKFKYPIVTTSAKLDFSKTAKSKNKIAVFDDTIDRKHARYMVESVVINGQKLIKCVNSRGTVWGDKGCFYLRYEDIGKVGTKYALVK